MNESTLNQLIDNVVSQGKLVNGFYELMLPHFTCSDGRVVQKIKTPLYKDEDSIDWPFIIMFENPRGLSASEKDFTRPDLNSIVTLTLNASKNHRIKKSAEDKLADIAKEYDIPSWEGGNEGVYYSVTPNDEAIICRKDKEENPTYESGIRVEIFPPYCDLVHNKTFTDWMKKDTMNGCCDYSRLGKLIDWMENGTHANRPSPIDMYYSDVADVLKDVKIEYLEDEYEEIDPNSNKLMRPAFDMVPYSFMLESIKSKILELICADVKKYDMQVDPRLSIAFADGENGLECNLTDNTVGVIIQGNQDNPDNLELSFIHGTSMDNPSWSADIPLERFPVESLILIYNNLK